jgi:hypothetical protein
MRDECTSVCSHCEEAWRAWRELIVTTPGLNESISGVILFDESIRQQKKNNTLFVKFHTDAGKYSPPVTDKGKRPTPPSKKLSPPLLSSDFCHEESIWPYRINRITTSKLGKPAD